MPKYQASVGLKLYYGAAYSLSAKTEIPGVTDTPQKGGTPDDITVNIISEKFVRHMNGQQDMGQMTYTFVPDFTPTTGSVAVINAAQVACASAAQWFYEEYEEGTWSSDTTPVYRLGPGLLYKGIITGKSINGQTGNSAQSSEFYTQVTGDSVYICSGGASPTYTDLYSGQAVTTPS